VSGFRRLSSACVGAMLTGACIMWLVATASAATVTTIATGLDNPRYLAMGPHHTLYVAEAGHGGSECIPEAYPEFGGPACVGFTGGISVVNRRGVHRVVTGLASEAMPNGFAATGIDGLSVLRNGTLFGIEALSEDKLSTIAPKETKPISSFISAKTNVKARQQLGQLIQVNRSGHWRAVANVGHFDFQWAAEHKVLVPEDFPEANPYGVFAEPHVRWVVDAASNTLDEVRPNGSVSVVAFIPNPQHSDSVPTCVGRGPDGALYVGELTGYGNGPGKSVVWRVVPGKPPSVWATGLTAVTGCGFAKGHFYATEYSTHGYESQVPGAGDFVLVRPHSTRPTVIASGLSFPQGFAAGPHGSFYVSNWSVAPAHNHGGPTGEVWQITP
jgi:hypothetical protein